MKQKMGIGGWLVSMLLFSLMLPARVATGQEWKVPTDTSYFRSGDDEWNLVESVLRNEPASVLLLLNRGTDPDARAEGGMTALMFAAESGDSLLVQLLVANGADLELTYVENTTPLLVSVLNQHFGITHYLLQKGADPDQMDDLGVSPLLYAAALNDFQTVDLLLYYGASDTIQDREGNTALMTAVFFGNIETADVLLQDGLSPDIPDKKGFTPLMIAAQQETTDMVSLLVEYGAQLELTDENNYTALAHAIRFHRPENARILVDSGANVHHQISSGQNLYDLAVQESQKDIKELLKNRGAEATPGPDFSEYDLGYGNSFNGKEHMMQARITLTDRKHGFFVETGYDFRPVYRKVQLHGENGVINQYREYRWAWTHGGGKLFQLYSDHSGIEYGLYGGLYGMLSSGSYRGLDKHARVHYSLTPSVGLYMRGRFGGMKAGAERYLYGTLHENPWKINVTIFIRFRPARHAQLYKEIVYEKR
jgi:ankyrin repeat protein